MAGKFFPVDLEVISKLLIHFRQDHWVHPILAYLVLCKHQQRGKSITTAGALAIAKALDITRYRAEKMIQELEQVRWGEALDERAIVNHRCLKKHPEMEWPHTLGRYRVKALPRISEGCVWLPNRILEEKDGQRPPLYRVIGIHPASDRYDTLSVLLHGYAYHDLEGSGGLDPRKTFWVPWCAEGSCFEGLGELGYQGAQMDRGEEWFFLLVARSDDLVAQKSFTEMVTEGDSGRLIQAVNHLKELGFLLEVGMVFDRDPLTSPSAEPLYPLRVYDALYRNNAKDQGSGTGGLYQEAHNCMVRSQVIEDLMSEIRYAIFASQDGISEESSGFYAVAAPIKTAMVLSVYRMRFSPHDHDTGIGFQAEADRAAAWQDKLSQSFR